MSKVLPPPHDAHRRAAIQRVLSSAVMLMAPRAFSATAPSSAAPDFTLRSVDGPNVRLQEQRGQVVLVNFWATWCGPCRQEMPQLNKLYDKYRAAGFNLLGINIDDDGRRAGDVVRKLGLRFPVLLDSDKAVSRLYDLSTMPTTLLIDRNGSVRHVHNGYLAGYEDQYDKEIRGLLK